MELLFQIFLVIHAIAGGLALISGLISAIAKKGSRKHKKSGIIYYWAMILVVITAIVMGLYKSNIFLLCIGVFSFYMVYTGKRFLNYKKEIQPIFWDWIICFGSMMISIGMLVLGITTFLKSGFGGVVPMLLVFGVFLFLMVLEDLKLYLKKSQQNGVWLLTHLGRISGSYIATITAFMVVNIEFNPHWVIWLIPTVIGAPIITYESIKWRKKLSI